MVEPLTRAELQDIASVLERSLQRHQQRIADGAATAQQEHHAEQLAREVAKIHEELNEAG